MKYFMITLFIKGEFETRFIESTSITQYLKDENKQTFNNMSVIYSRELDNDEWEIYQKHLTYVY